MDPGRYVVLSHESVEAGSQGKRPCHLASLPACLLLAVVLLGGCDTAFDPIGENGDTFFTINGYLDTLADTQFVRVSPVRTTAGMSGALDATVTTTLEDGTGGAPVVWRDSLVTLDDGQIGHLFYAPLQVQHGARYHLTVTRSDGATTEAEVAVPDTAGLTALPAQQVASVLEQDILWHGLSARPQDVVVHYCVRLPGLTPTTVSLAVTEQGRREPEGWLFTLRLTNQRARVMERLGLPFDDRTASLCGLSMSILELSPEWDAPFAHGNIENGFGFFGAVARHEDAWTLDPVTLGLLGFRPPTD